VYTFFPSLIVKNGGLTVPASYKSLWAYDLNILKYKLSGASSSSGKFNGGGL
jgi:hypothetical protein